MGSRVSLSALTIEEVAQMDHDTANSLRFYYNEPGLSYRSAKFVGYSLEEVRRELDERLRELDRNSTFGILSALEASFRMDFFGRCYERRKDDLSRCFRELHKVKGKRVALEGDILEAWKQHVPTVKTLISDVIGAFRYRHWLAHGRYWAPKFGQRYDFLSVYVLAQKMESVIAEQGS